jgi:hypothetical protein
MKPSAYLRIACFATLSGAAVSVAVCSPTRGPQAGPLDTIMIVAATKPEARPTEPDPSRASDDTVRPQKEGCVEARRVGPRNTIVRC